MHSLRGIVVCNPSGSGKPLGWGSAAALEQDSALLPLVNWKPEKPQTAVFSILLRNSICICSCVRAVCITSEDELLV